MKKIILVMLVLSLSQLVYAQNVETFEGFGLTPGSYLNGSDGGGDFELQNAVLNNDYNEAWDFWSGWAISADTDSENGSFENQSSSISGGGYDGSLTYAVAYEYPIIDISNNGPLSIVEGFYINNTTYAYKTLVEGNQFSKKFGGIDGQDKDYFRIHILGYVDGAVVGDTITFYLADYRSDNPEEDYVVNEWTWVDTGSLGHVDSLTFAFESTDIGQFGINTPLYFAMDNLTTAELSSTENVAASTVKIFPNPTKRYLYVDDKTLHMNSYEIMDTRGSVISSGNVNNGISVEDLNRGVYFIRLINQDGLTIQKTFIKQ